MKIVDFITKLNDWFRGDIDREGEKQLEAFAQQDDFAREALEGYRSFSEQQHELTIDRLKNKLNQQSDKKKGFYWVRIAASIVLILGLGTMFWVVNAPEVSKKVAQAEAASSIQEKTTENAIAEEVFSEKDKDNNVEAEAPKEKHIFPAPPKHAPKMPATKKLKSKEKDNMDAEEISATAQVDEKKTGKNKLTPLILNEDRQDVSEPMKDKAEPPVPSMVLIDGIALDSVEAVDNKNLFIGMVKSIDEKPLEGVKITAFGTNVTTLTNIDGKFVVEYTPDLSALLLETKDYEPLSIPISKQEDLTLYLSKEENSFMSGEKKRKKMNAMSKTATSLVEPKQGFEHFGAVVEAAIQYPPAAKLAHIEGDVELTFVVLSDGSISNVKVLASPDESLSKEAVRVFKNLPKWLNNTGKSRVLTYSVPFRIK